MPKNMKTEHNMKLSAYENFLSGIKKKTATLEEYTRKLNVYQKFFKIESWDALNPINVNGIVKSPIMIKRDDFSKYIYQVNDC